MQKKYATGRPDQKDLNENLAATQGLAHMIIECNRLFEVHKRVADIQQGFFNATSTLFICCQSYFMLLLTH